MADETSIGKIKGITTELVARFREQKLDSIEQLLFAGCSQESRATLARRVSLSSSELLALLNRADLCRITGIGEAYTGLLEEADVFNTMDLSKRVPALLYNRLVEINRIKKITAYPPNLQQVAGWVAEAKRLPVLLK